VITVHITGSALLVSRATCKISNSEVGDDGHGRSFGRKQNIVFKGCRNREVSSEPDHRHGENGIAGWERAEEDSGHCFGLLALHAPAAACADNAALEEVAPC
jgi:hypothetical protein